MSSGLTQETSGTFAFGKQRPGCPHAEHPKTKWGVVDDVLLGPSVLAWSTALSEFAFQHGEYRVLTCDGTVKIALALKGYKAQHLLDVESQCSHGLESGGDGQPSLYCARNHWIRPGRCAQKDKAACIIIDNLSRQVETTRLQCVEFISVDFATMALHHSWSAVFPRVRALGEDPVHLVVKFKTANGNHASPVSYRVSRVVAMFRMPSKGGSSPNQAVAASARHHRVPCCDTPSHVRG